MAKQQILLVDADSSSARLLEVSLRSAGYTVATAGSAESALGKLEHGAPDLIVTEARLPGVDGFAFVRQLRAKPDLAQVPIVFLTEQGALEDKLRGLELGVDDYLAKPIMVREVVTRVQLLLARKKQQRIAAEPQARTRFSGSLEDVAVVDLLQTIAVSGKSGVASVKRGDREAWLYFDKGQVIDAQAGDLRGEEAVYRTITWTTGVFDLEFRAIEREKVIDAPYQALLMEGLRRVDELGRLAEQLPPETAIVDIDHDALASRLNEIPDELNGILRLIDGKRTLLDLVDDSPFDDLSTLTVLSKFYFEGLLSSSNPEPVEWAPGSGPSTIPRADSSLPGSGEGSAATLVPPVRPAPSTVPAPPEPPPEAHRPTPAPVAASAVAPVTARAGGTSPDVEAKVTPKGIVNVGDNPPPPPKAMPSPFRVANDAPRRSPIPMPAGSTPRSNGAANHNAGSSNGGRVSRTMFGLSANTPQQAPVAERKAPVSSSGDPLPAVEAREQAKAREASPEHARIVDRSPPPPAVEREPIAATAAAPPSSRAPTNDATGEAPEPEHEFFEAGDEGTYAGGPRSGIPQPLLGHDHDEPPAPRRRHSRPSGHARTRRGTRIVAFVLVAAAVPLVVALWQKLAARTDDDSREVSSVVTAEPTGASAVQHDGNTGAGVAPTSADVSSAPVTAGAAEAALTADAAAPADAAPAPPPPGAAAEAPAAAVEPSPAAPAPAPAATPPLPASEPARPAVAAKPRPRAARNVSAVAPSPPAAPEAPPAPAPEKSPAPSPELRPGEKPPTAAYPLH